MKKSHVVLHHSLTKDSGTVSWGAIRRFHVETQGWTDIGYHLGIEDVGGRYEVLLGRPLGADGAHAYQGGMNRIGLGVLFVGNFDEAPPPQEMLILAARHLRDLVEVLGIPIDRSHVIGHREVAAYKSCPGRMFDLEHFVRLLEEA